ncbi:MAG: SRPBCC family protein [Angustibacter sp.]
MNRVFEVTRHVAASPAQVWSLLSDVAGWPGWTPTVDRVERLDDGTFGVGSRARVRQPRLRPAVWEVTELVDGERFTWVSRTPGVTTVGRHEVVADDDGSRVTLSIEQTGPLSAVAALFWGRLTQRYVDTEAESLARRVSGSTSP